MFSSINYLAYRIQKARGHDDSEWTKKTMKYTPWMDLALGLILGVGLNSLGLATGNPYLIIAGVVVTISSELSTLIYERIFSRLSASEA